METNNIAAGNETEAFASLLVEAKSLGVSDEDLEPFTKHGDLEPFTKHGPSSMKLLSAVVKQLRLKVGTYFTTIDDFVVPESKATAIIEESEYKKLCRRYGDKDTKKTHCRMKTQEASKPTTNDPYRITWKSIVDDPNLSAASTDGQSRRSLDSDAKATIWPCSITRPTLVSKIAHLVPASKADADSYFFVVDFLFGCETRNEKTSVGLSTDPWVQKQ